MASLPTRTLISELTPHPINHYMLPSVELKTIRRYMKKYSSPNLPLKFKIVCLRTPKVNRRMVHSGPAPRCFCICFRADSAANLVLCNSKEVKRSLYLQGTESAKGTQEYAARRVSLK